MIFALPELEMLVILHVIHLELIGGTRISASNFQTQHIIALVSKLEILSALTRIPSQDLFTAPTRL
jgi:hypothetical protein